MRWLVGSVGPHDKGEASVPVPVAATGTESVASAVDGVCDASGKACGVCPGVVDERTGEGHKLSVVAILGSSATADSGEVD